MALRPGSKPAALAAHLRAKNLALPKAELVAMFGENALKAALRAGAITRALPGVFTASEQIDDPLVRARAAGVWSAPSGAVSGQVALALWCGDAPPSARITVELPSNLHRAAPPGIRVTRPARSSRHFRVSGVRVVDPGAALVQTWNEAARRDREGIVIRAVQHGSSVDRIAAELANTANVRDRAALTELLGLLDGGVTSYLEWVARSRVFPARRFPHLIWQHTVRAAGRARHPDAYDPEAKIALEFDGRGTHGSDADRRSDLERDADLAGIGIQLLHFTTEDVLGRPAWCVQKYLDARDARLRQSGGR